MELELTLNVKVKTSLGSKIFNFETNKIEIEENVTPQTVHPKKGIQKQIEDIRSRITASKVQTVDDATGNSEKNQQITKVAVEGVVGIKTVRPPPTVILTPVNKKRAPFNRESGNKRNRRISSSASETNSESESASEDYNDNVPCPAGRMPAIRKSRMIEQSVGSGGRGSRGGARSRGSQGGSRGSRGGRVGQGGRGGRGGHGKKGKAASTALRPAFLDAAKKRKKF